MSYLGSFHAADDGRRGRDMWPWPGGPSGPPNPNAPKSTPAPKPKPAPPRQPAKKQNVILPDQGMPVETVICSGKPHVILSRFCYNSWALRDDMWERHRHVIQGIARDVIDGWIDMMKPKIKHICLTGYTDWHGEEDYNIHLGRARANTVRDALCEALIKLAQCRGRLDIVTQITIAAGTGGESNPQALGKSDEARACNRRVEVYLMDFEGVGRKCPINVPIPPRKPQGGGPLIT
jgi:hypothetical protein